MILSTAERRIVSVALRSLARETRHEIDYLRLTASDRPIRTVLLRDLATLEQLAERIES